MGTVTESSPVGLTSRPAIRRSNSMIDSAIVAASAIMSSPAEVGSYPARERSKRRAPTAASTAASRRKTVD